MTADDANVAVHPTALKVHKEITVQAEPARAFEIFTAEVDSWWNREHHNGPGELDRVVIEPHEGGRCYNRDAGGDEYDWGRVLAWEPPNRLLLAWKLNAQWTYDPDFETEVELIFTPVGAEETRVVLEHRNLDRYGAVQEEMHAALDSEGGWGGSIARYAEFVRSSAKEG